MNTVRSFLGRRQFLIAATAASTSALAYKKLAKVVNPIFHTNVAMASDNSNSRTADLRGMSKRYGHLLSPIKIRNVIVKNRMIHTMSNPHYLQGPEIFPADALRSYYSAVAKSAAIVSVRINVGGLPRKERAPDSARTAIFDTSDPAVQNYIDQMIEGVHCYGSLVIGSLGSGKDIVTRAKQAEDQGIDVVSMGGARDLKDKEVVRSAIDQMQAVQKATNLIILTSVSVRDPSQIPEISSSNEGITLEDAIAVAKTFEGSADILQVQIQGMSASHPTAWNQERGKPMSLRVAQAIKESGAKIIVAPRCGFGDPDLNEEFIASGKCDMIAMARAYIADPGYGKKIYEGRGEDVVPCILCNRCHGISLEGHWISVCSVNPRLGLDSAVKVIDAPVTQKKVAVIGGGPGGMQAAIVAAERGHRVTLYEKNDYLGGLLHIAEFDPYRWPHKAFKDYLVRQINKAGIEVILKTSATPEMIKAKGYDAVLVAIGTEPIIPPIPGVDVSNTYNVVNVFPKEKSLGKDVVLIGGGDYGTETGMFLAKCGHNVTILTSENQLLRIDRMHYPEIIQQTYDSLRNFKYVLEATTRGISGGKVTYVDSKGNEKSIQADSVVIYGGLKPKQDEALKFFGSAEAFFSIGDCSGKGGNIQKVIRGAFFAASQI